MTGNEAIAAVLEREGVEYLFCFPHNPLIDAVSKLGIKPIIGRTERTIINMADGYTRVSRGKKIGVVAVQYGPGSENAFGGVAQAAADSVPIIVLTGGYALHRNGITPLFNAIDHYQGITKWAAQITGIQTVTDRVRRAFALARNGHGGPIMLQLPLDVGDSEFGGDIDDYTSPRAHRSMADPADVDAAAAAILAAKSPVIHAGMGILWADASAELIDLAETAKIPVVTTLNGKSGFPENHELSLGLFGKVSATPASDFMKTADLIIGAGSSFTIANQQAAIPPGKLLIQITNSDTDIHKDYAVDHVMLGDAKLVLAQLTAAIKTRISAGASPAADPRVKVAAAKKNWMDEWLPRLTSDEEPINPYRVIWDLMHSVDLGTTVVTHDAGNPRDQMAPFWQALPSAYYIGWGKSTQLGYGHGLAYGAKLAMPDRLVVNVMGDTAVGMSGMDFETAVRNDIGVITVILNNGEMGGYDAFMPAANERYNAKNLTGDYAGVAAALGCHTRKVDKIADLKPAIERAKEVVAGNRPAVIEVKTRPDPVFSR
ncbi:MAG: thiamine pyrophosphate-requiring protein [Chloroflexota bacterium]|jgi:acetolactate synthase-1/2/3 large subunit|nr:thiamine pyrophosphate-requiring protein [Chloroflexota bacterium]MDP6758280.1 thiamine pyrophosphate-requiring protein [Chloroflexota bacterium]